MRTKIDLTPFQNGKDTDYLDLEKFYGKKIKKVLGYLGGDGFMAFGLSRIVFEDESEVFVEGAHDFAYIYDYKKIAPIDTSHIEYGDEAEGEDENDYYYDDWE